MSDAYRAKTHIEYRHEKTGKYVAVEAGEKAEGLNAVAVKAELNAGNIEPWTEEEGEKK